MLVAEQVKIPPAGAVQDHPDGGVIGARANIVGIVTVMIGEVAGYGPLFVTVTV
jgi:hypothetical protein